MLCNNHVLGVAIGPDLVTLVARKLERPVKMISIASDKIFGEGGKDCQGTLPPEL
jgi:hypothetical protein